MRKLAEFTLIALLALPLLCWASGAEAGCSGSGTTWNCTAGTTSAELSSVLSSASDGATITFASGSYNWNSFVSFNNAKGATVICATVGGCNVTANGPVLGMNGKLSGINNHFYRISGFKFSGSGYIIWFYGPGTMTQIRIDHNAFNVNTGANAMILGENSTVALFYGVIDHNTLTSPGTSNFLFTPGGINPNPPAAPLGTANNMFVEDNTITMTNMTNAGDGCIDGWATPIVYRRNTATNCLVTSHGSLHKGGPQNFELYNNTIIQNSGSIYKDCYRCFHHQGSGEFIAFNNILTPYSGRNSDAIAMLYYRDEARLAASEGGVVCDGTQTGQTKLDGVPVIDGNRSPTTTYRGYPCWHQPGRDFAGNLVPMYAWGNKWSDTGAKIDLTQENFGGYFAQHRMADRDYYNAVGGAQTSPTTPFNGTTGMGYGTLANRPTTCSVGKTDPADAGKGGVGYFATDVGPQGTLYQCSSTNTWKVWYTPYTYPHPLVSGSATPAITSASSASGTAGKPFSYTITASNNPTSFNATGMPAGLSVNKATGAISGTPSAAGTFKVTLSATNAKGTGTATLALTINVIASPTITSALSASGTVGTPFSYTITATNSPTSFSAAVLPPGLSVNTLTGVISGTPTTAGVSSFTVRAANVTGTGSAIVTLTINAAASRPAITSALAASGTAGTPFSYTITATNNPTSFNATGLPAGLSVNTTTGVISGRPSAAGRFNIALSATNAKGTGSATLAVTINAGTAASASLFLASDVPAVVNVNDTRSVELGVKFTSSNAGNITGFRFYKGSQDTGTHTAHLWSATGTLLASATFAGETASGWQQVNLTTPVRITAGTTYVASYHTSGHYSANGNYFATAHTNGPLTAPSSAASGGNGVYKYGSAVSFPSNTYNANNYWVDVVFAATVTPPAGSSLFSGINAPPVVIQNDPNSVELGVKFYAARAGNITGVRFYKNSRDTGTHTAHLWSRTGTLLASATFAGETASGWQQVNLPRPVAINANTTYIVSYHSNGNYSETNNYFNNAYTNGPLTAPSSSSSGGNSVYAYGSAATFPNNTYAAANYWVDVVFQ